MRNAPGDPRSQTRVVVSPVYDSGKGFRDLGLGFECLLGFRASTLATRTKRGHQGPEGPRLYGLGKLQQRLCPQANSGPFGFVRTLLHELTLHVAYRRLQADAANSSSPCSA